MGANRWQLVRRDDRTANEGDRAFDGVLQLADVARPGVALEHVDGLGRDVSHIDAELGRVAPQEVPGQQVNVAAARP